jgi:hypothetical protein
MVGESTNRGHDFDHITHRCKRCGLSYLTLMGGGSTACTKEVNPSAEKEQLKGDALWDSIVDVARGS